MSEAINKYDNNVVHAGILQDKILTLMVQLHMASDSVLHMLISNTDVEELTDEKEEQAFIAYIIDYAKQELYSESRDFVKKYREVKEKAKQAKEPA